MVEVSQGTAIGQIPRFEPPKKTPREKCEESGGTWDPQTQTCLRPQEELKDVTPKPPPKPTEDPKNKVPESFVDSETGRPSGITLPDGRTFFGVNKEEIENIAAAQQQQFGQPEGTLPVGTQANLREQQAQGQLLAGQVGQFGQLGTEERFLGGVDVGAAATAGVVGAIPRALSLAAGGAALGAAGGTALAPGVGTAGGAVIGAIGGFVSGITSSMISSAKSQRADTTTAQQRVLDEGKQTMKDWATLAKADPANKAFYLAEYNKVSAQVDQAYRQMKLDTSRDVTKFETALPNLAEFEAFYAAGGERDTLNIEMQNSLLTPSTAEYDLLELAERRR